MGTMAGIDEVRDRDGKEKGRRRQKKGKVVEGDGRKGQAEECCSLGSLKAAGPG